jgi:hypothetical protein
MLALGLLWLAIAVPATAQAPQPLAPQARIVVNHDSVGLFERIPPEYLDAARTLSMFYTDRSVGDNLSDGIDCMSVPMQSAPSHCKRWDHVVPTYQIASEPWSGSYPRPSEWRFYAGCTDVDCTISQQAQLGYDIFGYFPSYLDGQQLTVPELERLYQARGNATLLAWTTSLARASEDNLRVVNEQIRDWASRHDLPVLDAADILSHRPDGTQCYDNRDGVAYYAYDSQQENHPNDGLNTPAICQEYTTEADGGHLGSVSQGKIRLAKAVWVMMAQLAGWDPAAPLPIGDERSHLPLLLR